MLNSETLNSLVSITQFNKGQASKIFDRLKTENQLIVLKNNVPIAILLSPDEYNHLTKIAENYTGEKTHEASNVNLDKNSTDKQENK